MKVSIASDHGGYELKQHLIACLEKKGFEMVDFGCNGLESCDYADFGVPACKAVTSGEVERCILVCTTGIGMSMAANKVRGIRCAHCADTVEASLTRRHNDANCMAIGAGFTGPMLAEEMCEIFLTTEFEGGRHARRVGKIMALENEQ